MEKTASIQITLPNQYSPTSFIAQSDSYYYGDGNYNVDPSYGGDINGKSGLNLSNTGTVIWLGVVVASVIIMSAILVRIWRKPKKESS